MASSTHSTKLFTRLVREPLVQFVTLGALIFVVVAAFDRLKVNARPQIVIDDAVVSRIAGVYQKQFGSLPEAAQLKKMIETYTREEVLYREALRLHLDDDDAIIRRRLVQKMEFLASRSIEQPSDESLRAYYTSHLDQFKQAARVSFEHLYFSPDNGGAESAIKRAEQTLIKLHSTENQHRDLRTDSFPLQLQYSRIAREDATQIFGNNDLADALFRAPLNTWIGPLRSGYGWHLIKVSERTTERMAAYADVIDQVKAEYARDSGEQQTNQAINDIAARYEIVRTAKEFAQ
jgi:peptidyl-prolyl cis-trans isomerase C